MRARWAVGRPATFFARFSTLVVAGHLSQAADAAFGDEPPLILGIEGLDARPLFVIATVLGVAYAFLPFDGTVTERIRWAWLVALTVCAWGRALSILFIGAPGLDRGQEFAEFAAWSIVWIAGILAAMILTAAEILHRR